jgi:hypothetical protein
MTTENTEIDQDQKTITMENNATAMKKQWLWKLTVEEQLTVDLA